MSAEEAASRAALELALELAREHETAHGHGHGHGHGGETEESEFLPRPAAEFLARPPAVGRSRSDHDRDAVSPMSPGSTARAAVAPRPRLAEDVTELEDGSEVLEVQTKLLEQERERKERLIQLQRHNVAASASAGGDEAEHASAGDAAGAGALVGAEPRRPPPDAASPPPRASSLAAPAVTPLRSLSSSSSSSSSSSFLSSSLSSAASVAPPPPPPSSSSLWRGGDATPAGGPARPLVFERVEITGAGDVQHPAEVRSVCRRLLQAAALRDKYQYDFGAQCWSGIDPARFEDAAERALQEAVSTGGVSDYRRRVDPPFTPFPESESESIYRPRRHRLGRAELSFEFVEGVAVVTRGEGAPVVGEAGGREVLVQAQPPSMAAFYEDLGELVSTTHDAAVKSLCFKRLQLLDSLFGMHRLLNADRETEVQKTVPHRDFYNIRKVDTHIHHSAIMNCKHLLRFIKSKLKHCGNEVVIKRDGAFLTLEQVFKSIKLTAYDLSIDTLDMHAGNVTFHRFDRFNLKYNPIGESRLREIFLKTDNLLAGRYLAEVTREVFSDCEANKYVMLEPRVSIYGRELSEWTKLAAWYHDNRLASCNVRWMIQVPRLYSVYKELKLVGSFQDMITNIFQPLFEVTLDPSKDAKLDNFLLQVSGFDCVDDESRLEQYSSSAMPAPADWKGPSNPPYSYWIYFIYANIFALNALRASLGMSTFSFRPHAGEAGDLNNLAATFLCAQHINHGILLRKAPTLQYLYFLKQIGLAMSPLSNNKLFLDYHSNPFPVFFARGLNVSLSTDDPLMLHLTKDPLVEEYGVASQVWRLSSTDVCEIARNSVLQSGFEHPYKKHFLGQGYERHNQPPHYGNNINYTNVPDIRVVYRRERLEHEWSFVKSAAAQP